jgi:hypothetical protein
MTGLLTFVAMTPMSSGTGTNSWPPLVVDIALHWPEFSEDVCNDFASELSAYLLEETGLPEIETDYPDEDFGEWERYRRNQEIRDLERAAWDGVVNAAFDEAKQLLQAEIDRRTARG